MFHITTNNLCPVYLTPLVRVCTLKLLIFLPVHLPSFSRSHFLPFSPRSSSSSLSGPENTVPVGLLYLITLSALWSTVNNGAKSPQNKIHSGGPCITQLSPGTNQAPSMPVALQTLAGPKAAGGSEWDRLEPMKESAALWDSWHPTRNMRRKQTATAERQVSDLQRCGYVIRGLTSLLHLRDVSDVPRSVKDGSSDRPAGQWAV